MHGVSYSNVLPTTYILLLNKEEDIYKRMYFALKTFHPQLSPKSIMFEKGSMIAEKCISFSRNKRLFFYLCQSIWQHIQFNGL
jgi:hypothetical protein